MQVSLDFNERHFQKGGILEQPWKQFLATSDVSTDETEIKQLFEDFQNVSEEVESRETEIVEILEVPAVGPVLKPLSTGVPAWLWVIFGILVFLLVVALSQGFYQQYPVAAVKTPVVETQFFVPGISGPGSDYPF